MIQLYKFQCEKVQWEAKGIKEKIKNCLNLIGGEKKAPLIYIDYIKSDLHNFGPWPLLIRFYLGENPLISLLHSRISAFTSGTQAVIKHRRRNVNLLVLQFILTQSRWGGENKWQMKSHPSRLQLQTSKIKKATFRGRSHDPQAAISARLATASQSCYTDNSKSILIPVQIF